MTNLKSVVKDIISQKQFRTVYQPIVSLSDGCILGYEALSRGPSGTKYESPLTLIGLAEDCDAVWELDFAFRSAAIERATGLLTNQLLFINVDPKIIYDKDHHMGMTREKLKSSNISPDQIVFEITERSAIDDYEGFNQILQNYMRQGYGIAIDDAGAGFSGLNRIIETRPNYIKLDMNIIREIDKDSFKQAIVKSFAHLCHTMDIKLIAEGIETKEELKCIIKLGVHCGQGYYLQKPSEVLLAMSRDKRNEIEKYCRMAASSTLYSAQYNYIGSIAESVRSVNHLALCKEVEQQFKKEGNEAFCILDRHHITGLITKAAFDRALSGPNGHAVYSNRDVMLIADAMPLIVDYYTPIHLVAESAINRSDEQVYDPIIVKRGTYYYGLVSVRNLLQYAIAYERDYAGELNPLTKLPGNTIINRVLNDLVVYKGVYALLYFDLDNFKAYNDVYGFDNGDKIIKMTSKLIEQKIKSFDAINSFVGHIGGDDFVSVLKTDDKSVLKELIDGLLKDFDCQIEGYYNESDRINMGICAEDRFGHSSHYPIMTLSAAGLYGNFQSIASSDELGRIMAVIKKASKRNEGSWFELVDMQENECNQEI